MNAEDEGILLILHGRIGETKAIEQQTSYSRLLWSPEITDSGFLGVLRTSLVLTQV